MLRISNHNLNFRFSCAVLFVMLLLTACSPRPSVSVPPQLETLETLSPVPSTELPTDSQSNNSVTDPDNLTASLNLNGIGQSFTTEVIDSLEIDEAEAPYWEVMPQYTLLTLEGYPITNHQMKPQIFIYPANKLKNTNEGAGKILNSLQNLLKNQQIGENLPFLPMINATQVMFAQVNFQDFQDGQGVRYITQYGQGPLPINNYELFYTYQGLTNDGKYYVAAVLPVNLSSLPADPQITGQDPMDFINTFYSYLENTVNDLNQQDPGLFTPDLSLLDEMVKSIEIN